MHVIKTTNVKIIMCLTLFATHPEYKFSGFDYDRVKFK